MGWTVWAAAIGILAMAGSAEAETPAQAAPQLTLEAVFGSPSISGPTPRALKLSPDGRYATLLKARANDRTRFDLWAIDIATGQERMLIDSEKLSSGAEISEAEKMRRERARLAGIKGIVSYDWAPDGRAILVPLDGDLWLAPLDGAPKRLTNTPETELDAKVSETGRYVSFVRGGNLFVADTVTAKATQLTTGASDTLSWGSAEFVAQEELDRSTGHWWSPDDRRIAVARVDESGVGIVPRAAIGAEGTRVFNQRYPKAGTPNAKVDLFIFATDGSGRVQVDLGPNADIYLARVGWSKDGRTLYVQRLNREQTRLDLLAADPLTGRTQLILSETAKTWVNLPSDGFGQGGEGGLWPLTDGGFLWLSERDGFQHLYRWKAGRLIQLTKGRFVVSKVGGVDEANGLAIVEANRDTPLERHVYSVPIGRAGEMKRLTALGGWHYANVDRGAHAMIVQRATPTQPPQSYLARADGSRVRWIEENRIGPGHPFAPYANLLTEPEFGTLRAADGQMMHWKLLKPAGAGPFPVYYQVYGGPHAQQVTRGWVSPFERWLTTQGWAVFQLDNRGSGNRGKAFEDPLYHAMGGVEVTDQLAALSMLKARVDVSAGRIVVSGWSYGGYMALKLLEAAPGQFAGGISGAPPTAWDLYDTAYTERYLGSPNGAGRAVYDKADALPAATTIRDPLLVIHGMSDDNVVFENSTRLFAALQQAKIPFEMMVYPGQTHGFAGPAVNIHRALIIRRFLAEREQAAAH
ncbi:MAG: DPP IV N-terminal domain-containing protein [Sphingomonadaceae bacterium]|nr:DPP IV N-terminal domain-containing protein [Sphingomonadaceae bacterium]